MRKRNMLAYAILIVGSIAAFYCYSRLAELLPMSDATMVEKTDARITEVITPMVKKGQSTSDVMSNVRFAFTVDGKTIEGGFSVKDREPAPKKGAVVPVAYRIDRPTIFLQAAEYDALPRQLSALRILMWGFALIAMVLPFFVMNHRA
ncbi:MAG: hypothetical protein K2X09_06280 [Rickettsiales bacterium]|nr:hypothetical protein [Rickettsiales bacterium]